MAGGSENLTTTTSPIRATLPADGKDGNISPHSLAASYSSGVAGSYAVCTLKGRNERRQTDCHFKDLKRKNKLFSPPLKSKINKRIVCIIDQIHGTKKQKHRHNGDIRQANFFLFI